MANLEKRARLKDAIGGIRSKPQEKIGNSLEDICRRLDAPGPFVVLIDGSSSMADRVPGGEPKYILLGRALADQNPRPDRAILFHDGAGEIDVRDLGNLPFPDGSTNMTAALALAAAMEPSRTLLISDGAPCGCSKESVRAAARSLPGILNTLFVGDERDAEAIAFMRELAKIGCGATVNCHVSSPGRSSLLASAIAGLLPPVRT